MTKEDNYHHNKYKIKDLIWSISVLLLVVWGCICIYNNYVPKGWFGHKAGQISDAVEDNNTYSGPIYHVFFHSLVVYPELAFQNDAKGLIYKEYMVTQDTFKKFLNYLYANNFVLVDIHSIYAVQINADGTKSVTKKTTSYSKRKKATYSFN